VAVPVPVVGDDVVVPVEDGTGEAVGEGLPVGFPDADGVGDASGPEELAVGVAVGLDPGVPLDGDGVGALPPSRFVNVVPVVDELPSG
jgi:hypothetical protein